MPSRNPRHPSSLQRGFSIIELIVVIGVVMVLLGIFLPALGGAKQSAHDLKQSSQLRQLMVAVSLYCDSWDDVFPMADTRPWSAPGYIDTSQPIDFGKPWWSALTDGGIMTEHEAFDEEQYNIHNVAYSMTLGYAPRILTPSTIIPWELRTLSPIRQHAVRYPSDKGACHVIQTDYTGTFSPWCCLYEAPPGSVAFLDSSVTVMRWTDFPEPSPAPILDIGDLINTTWHGVHGKDR